MDAINVVITQGRVAKEDSNSKHYPPLASPGGTWDRIA
jgi:hypothetical protein